MSETYPKMKRINIIVCCDKDWGIGKNGVLPWKNIEEMKIFKTKTIGNGNNCVIMGRKTFESIPEKFRPLSERQNWILTSQSSSTLCQQCSAYLENNVEIFNTHYEIIHSISNPNHRQYDAYWIIGGESVYHFFMTFYKDLIHEIHLSLLEQSYQCDNFFPLLQNDNYEKIIEDHYDGFTHYVFRRKN